MIRLSATKIKTFSTCNRQYYYKYFDRLPTGVSGRALLGRCVHKAIELGFQGQDPMSVYNQYWIEGVPTVTSNDNMGKLYNEGLKMVDLYDFNQIPPLEMELGFELPFPNREEPVVLIQGFFDQILRGDVLVDLKTGLRRPKPSVLKYSTQFVLYAWAYRELYGKLPKIYWHHLRTGDKILADIGEEQIASLFPIIMGLKAQLTYADQIEQYPRNVDDMVCGMCSFRGPCLGEEEE